MHGPFLKSQNLQFEFIKEEVGYGTIDLVRICEKSLYKQKLEPLVSLQLCDVGGTLSLLMGASLLTCCELLEVAWFTSVQTCCRRGRRVRRRLTQRRRKKRGRSAEESAASTDGSSAAGASRSGMLRKLGLMIYL